MYEDLIEYVPKEMKKNEPDTPEESVQKVRIYRQKASSNKRKPKGVGESKKADQEAMGLSNWTEKVKYQFGEKDQGSLPYQRYSKTPAPEKNVIKTFRKASEQVHKKINQTPSITKEKSKFS